jgi:phosphoadenosine phosphosulfate reductase
VKDHLQEVQAAAEHWRTEEVLSWALETFGGDVAISTGMGVEGMVLLDYASRISSDFQVFTLDTEFLFPETYDLMERVEKRYGIRIERVFSSLTPEEQERKHGAGLWARNPDQCCHLRKVEPLRRKLSTLRAWITAIRRDQTAARASAKKVEWDARFGLVKINPLADWNSAKIWDYVRKHDVPYNILHDLNHPSIGCTHCTRAVLPGEDARAGRWAGFKKTECGLHAAGTESGPVLVRIGAGD